MSEKTWFFIIGSAILLFNLYQQYRMDKQDKKLKFLVEQYIIMMLTINLLTQSKEVSKEVKEPNN